jgi:hypothetical protein
MHRDAVLPRFTTWLVLVAYALIASGLPLPFGVAGPDARHDQAAGKRLAAKDRSQPFPCMDKPCGCATAEQCFTRCCCNTPAETLAWARARRVDAAVLEALVRRVAAETPRPAGGCCAVREESAKQPSCCQQATPRGEAASAADVCSEFESLAAVPASRDRQGEAEEPPPAGDPPSGGTGVIVLREMLACGGIVAAWFTASVSLPPPKLSIDVFFPLVARLTVVDDASRDVLTTPESPPPRSHAA